MEPVSACRGVAYVLHQAALGSVPRSIEDPIRSNASNVTGTGMLIGGPGNQVSQFVFASSSSIYGDDPDLPEREQSWPPALTYAVTKCVNNLYAEVFFRCYGFVSSVFIYFNEIGPRQDPGGPYAAVIPRWISSMITNEPVRINGDGETSRDFCYIQNVVQVNLLAGAAEDPQAINQVYNVALNTRTTLNELFGMIHQRLCRIIPLKNAKPIYDFRQGDVRHSTDISKVSKLLDFTPRQSRGRLGRGVEWYKDAVR